MEVVQRVRQHNRVFLVLLPAIMGIVVLAALVILRSDKPVIPTAIKNQVVTTIFLPNGALYSVDSTSVKYVAAEKLLIFKITSHGRSIAAVAEQPTPEKIVDIQEFSSKFFQQAGEYKTFESNYGTVHLLHPGKSGYNAAAMNARGTLMFINPSIKMSEDDWRRLFQSIVAIQ